MSAPRASFSRFLADEAVKVSALVRDGEMAEAHLEIEGIVKMVMLEQDKYGLDQSAYESFKKLHNEMLNIASNTQ